VDTQCYQRFLNEFSQTYSDSLNILRVDNGRFHASKGLIVPENVKHDEPVCTALNTRFDVLPQQASDEPLLPQVTIDAVMTHLIKMLARLVRV
jgi:hypothetical protein